MVVVVVVVVYFILKILSTNAFIMINKGHVRKIKEIFIQITCLKREKLLYTAFMVGIVA